MPFRETTIVEIRKDMESANFIPSASPSTYDRHIRVIRLCLGYEKVLPFVEQLNRRNPLTGNKSKSCIEAINLEARQFNPLHRCELRLCLECMCSALNAKVGAQKRPVRCLLLRSSTMPSVLRKSLRISTIRSISVARTWRNFWKLSWTSSLGVRRL